MDHYKLYIGGKWVDSPEHFTVTDRYTGKPFATVAQATKEQVDAAVQSARRSFEKTKLSPRERYEILSKLGKLVREQKETIAQLLSHEVGKPIAEARTEAAGVAGNCENIAEEAKRIAGEMVPIDANPGSENRLAFTIRVPVGIVCAISPFNYPISLSIAKIAPAIAAGDTVIIKPTQRTPLAVSKLVELCLEAGFPPEHIQLILGSGSKAGEWLLQNNDINFYSFTGSAEVGEHITRTIGLRRCAMELGSNAAVIIHNDTDVEKAATACAKRGFYNAGQVCISVQRILVQKDVLPRFLSAAKATAESLVIGNPLDEKTTLGPMISEEDVKRVDTWVKEAVDGGATIVTGGKPEGDRFYLPTILTNVKREMKVWSQEVFGPLLAVDTYENFDEAIRKTNNSVYGLQAGVFTSNLALAMKAAREIECGGIIINDTAYFKVNNMPYGGLKRSGFGKEGGKYAVKEMTDEKLVIFTP